MLLAPDNDEYEHSSAGLIVDDMLLKKRSDDERSFTIPWSPYILDRSGCRDLNNQ
jgi:hypothetical protein